MMKNGIVAGPCDLIPGSGVNLEHHKPLPYPENKTTKFLFAGRIMENKGIEHFLDAAEEISSSCLDVEFHICGTRESDYHGRLDELVQSKTVIYHGSVEDMLEMYKMASCVVLPSYHEGMSNVLLEGCAHARPVIATDVPGCREVVDNGVNGYLVKPCDSRDLTDAIKRFLALSAEERESMGLNGRKKAEEEFDRRIVVNRYLVEFSKAR